MAMYRSAPPCSSGCPCRTVTADPNCLCGFTRCDKGSPYCEVTQLAERAVVSSKAEGGPGLSESAALLQAFDKMAAWHREQVARRVGGRVSIEGGADKYVAQWPEHRVSPGVVGSNPTGTKTPSDLDSHNPAPRCIENIPTSGKKVAHQCRNRAKYGPYCALHAVGTTAPDLEQFPAALVEQPDSLPWPE
jgi:hypothetical protein